jgi:hypothetical protein
MKRVYRDPITGDELSWLEYYTRQLQVVVRTPWFIIVFNVITLIAFLLNSGDKWNYFASWLAIIIEWLVGTYMFGQTARDAIVSRQTRANSQRIELIEQQNAAVLVELRANSQETRATSQRIEQIAHLLLKEVEALEEQE